MVFSYKVVMIANSHLIILRELLSGWRGFAHVDTFIYSFIAGDDLFLRYVYVFVVKTKARQRIMPLLSPQPSDNSLITRIVCALLMFIALMEMKWVGRGNVFCVVTMKETETHTHDAPKQCTIKLACGMRGLCSSHCGSGSPELWIHEHTNTSHPCMSLACALFSFNCLSLFLYLPR